MILWLLEVAFKEERGCVPICKYGEQTFDEPPPRLGMSKTGMASRREQNSEMYISKQYFLRQLP
jgi:hypothetical protein